MDANGNGSECSDPHQLPVPDAVASAVLVPRVMPATVLILSPLAFRFIRVA